MKTNKKIYKDNQYTLSIDPGLNNVGWALFDEENKKMVEMGVRKFEPAKEAKISRLKRSARRNNGRKKWRKQQLKQAFIDFNLISEEEFKNSQFYEFHPEQYKVAGVKNLEDLRCYALQNKVTCQELFQCIYNILKYRGNFLRDDIDFENGESLTEELLIQEITNFMIKSLQLDIDNLDKLKESISTMCNQNIDVKEIPYAEISDDKVSQKSIENVFKALKDQKFNPFMIEDDPILIDEEEGKSIIPEAKTKTIYMKSVQKCSDLSNRFEQLLNITDSYRLYKVLSGEKYICTAYKKKLDRVSDYYSFKDSPEGCSKYSDIESSKIEEEITYITNNMNATKGKPEKYGYTRKNPRGPIHVIHNVLNRYPNGLLVKEAVDILRTQQNYYGKEVVSDEFIDVIRSILKARIPYYIGPLSDTAKNQWCTKTGKFKYSYSYTIEHMDGVDEESSIKVWKDRMRGHCTYLPEAFALPKGSFVAETLLILNELNVLTAIDKNNNTYYLTTNDKIKVFDYLFLDENHYGDVKYKEICDLLDLAYFGPKNQKSQVKTFKQNYTLYKSITSICTTLKLHSIIDLFSTKFQESQLKTIEEIVLNLNLYDEKKHKYQALIKMGISDENSKKLSSLNSKKFYGLSEKFVLKTPLNKDGRCLLEILFEDNQPGYTNEMMTAITNACDMNGNPISFIANKYEAAFKALEKNGELELNFNSLLEIMNKTGNGFQIPASRPVLRSINQMMKVIQAVYTYYGVPKRIVLEIPRDMSGKNTNHEMPAKHYKTMEALHQDIMKQCKDKDHPRKTCIDQKWNDLKDFEVNSKNRVKLELYLRQNGMDMITGEKISLNELENYEIDHILPRGFGDDSMDDKILIRFAPNALKKDRTPLMWITDPTDPVINKSGKEITADQYINRVNELFDMKLISENKKRRLLLKDTEDLDRFINQNLVDTRYITREMIGILKAYNHVKGYPTKVIALKPAFTKNYSNAFDIYKNRDLGLQHHALDAAVLGITDIMLNRLFPNYESGRISTSFAKHHQMLADVGNDKKLKDSTKYVIRKMYEKVFGNSPLDYGSLVYVCKNTMPLYSQKSNRNWKGEKFPASRRLPYQKYDIRNGNIVGVYDDKSDENIGKQNSKVLKIFGINNKNHAFDSVNCVAYDIYRIPEKKNNKVIWKNIGIHIPKCIVDEDGTIQKDKYIKLIKKYYGFDDNLIDEKGDLITAYFKLRLYKNDLVGNTEKHEIRDLVLGSIADKKLELNKIDCFVYQKIAQKKASLFKMIIDNQGSSKYDIHNYKEYQECECKEEILRDMIFDNMNIKNQEFASLLYAKIINDKKLDLENINKICWILAYYQQFLNEITGKKEFNTGRGIGALKKDESINYFKLKTSPLGVRFNTEKNQWTGPVGYENAFKIIKKEAFTWKITV